jgi:drug/metabolite transporter (DMT)-like permease
MVIHTRLSNGLAIVATLFALAGAVVFSTPNLANAATTSPTTTGYRGAPGPIAGAGLPVLAAIGYGVYWLVKRRRKAE